MAFPFDIDRSCSLAAKKLKKEKGFAYFSILLNPVKDMQRAISKKI